MKAVAEIQVIPIGEGVSVREHVKKAHALLEDAGLDVTLHAFGTNVEGELGDIFRAIESVHDALHAAGIVRLSTAIKIGTRTDKEPRLKDKIFK